MTVEERIARIENLVLFLLEVSKNTGAFFSLANDEVKQHAATLTGETDKESPQE